MRNSARRRKSRSVIGDAERLLAGRCVEQYSHYGLSPPPWALVNDLAHSNLTALTKRATGRIMWRRPRPWERAQQHLAAVLVATTNPAELLCLQQEVMVPLELAILDRPNTYPETPEGLVDIVSQAVGQARNGLGS
jgi:hypothetical protein